MTRLMRLAARLYPSSWRQRYGAEFDALVDEMAPGWSDLFDVLKGAFAMQMRTAGVIPIVCALAGAFAGGVAAVQSPAMYASSATLRFDAPDTAPARSSAAREVRASLEEPLGTFRTEMAQTAVTVVTTDARQTTVRLTCMDRDPARAHRVAKRLTSALATADGGRLRSAQVLAAPDIPASSVRPHFVTWVASSGGVGLLAGAIVLLLVRLIVPGERARPG